MSNDEVLRGLRFVLERWIQKGVLYQLLLMTALVMPLFAFPVQFVLPVFIDEVYERDAGALGIMMAGAGLGGLVGTVIAARLDFLKRKGLIMLAGAALMGSTFIVFALTPSFWPALLVTMQLSQTVPTRSESWSHCDGL